MNRLVSIIVLASIASLSHSQPNFATREISSRTTSSGNIVTTNYDTINGIDVFGTSFKTIYKDIFKNSHVAISRAISLIENSDAIVDNFYKSYQEEIASNPEGHAMDYIHVVMDIEKT